MSVTELGYIGLNVSDIAAWRGFVSGFLGLEAVEGDEGRTLFLRMDYWHHRIVLHENGEDDIAYAGWRVAGLQELEDIEARLTAHNISYRAGSAQEAAERHVLGLIKLIDPGGMPIEVFYGPRIERSRPFHPGRPMHERFVTGEGGLGHIVIAQTDVRAVEHFYSRILGMRGSIEAEVELPSGLAQIYFFSCNQRQHSLAFGAIKSPKRLSHVMTEYSSLDDLGLAYDMVRRENMRLALELGRHFNDNAVSFYLPTPSGWMWEVGWGVCAPAGQAFYSQGGDIWGHDRVSESDGTG